jgi:hypothetical protein
MIRLLSGAAVALSLILPLQAGAQTSHFPVGSASACEKVSGPMKRLSDRVRFSSGKTGTIVLTCPIEAARLIDIGISTGFAITGRDSTGPGTGAHIKVRLLSTSKATGATTAELLFNSNTDATSAYGNFGGNSSPVPNVDQFVNTIEVEMKRTTTGQTVEFVGYDFYLL